MAIIRTAVRYIVVALAMLGLVAVGFKSVRGDVVELLSEKRSGFVAPTIVFIGDSLTVGGRPWGARISYDPFSAVTNARSGFLAWQMDGLANPRSWGFKPKFISYMAGTNDAGTDRITDEVSLRDQLSNIDHLIASGSKVIVTLAPPAVNSARSKRTRRMDLALQTALATRHVKVIDLWPELAANGVLQARYTIDGIHFSEPAYTIWSRHLREAMSKQP